MIVVLPSAEWQVYRAIDLLFPFPSPRACLHNVATTPRRGKLEAPFDRERLRETKASGFGGLQQPIHSDIP